MFRVVVITDQFKKKLSETFLFFLTESTGDVVWKEQFLLCDWLDEIVLTGIIQINIKSLGIENNCMMQGMVVCA